MSVTKNILALPATADASQQPASADQLLRPHHTVTPLDELLEAQILELLDVHAQEAIAKSSHALLTKRLPLPSLGIEIVQSIYPKHFGIYIRRLDSATALTLTDDEQQKLLQLIEQQASAQTIRLFVIVYTTLLDRPTTLRSCRHHPSPTLARRDDRYD